VFLDRDFLKKRDIFGDSRTFKAYIINICMDFQDFLAQNVFCWGSVTGGRGGEMLTPTKLFLLLGVLTSVLVLAKIDQEMRP